MPEKTVAAQHADYPNNTGLNKSATYLEVTECPVCHFSIRPTSLYSCYAPYNGHSSGLYSLYVVDFCPNCRNAFLSEYRTGGSIRSRDVLVFGHPIYSVPSSPPSDNFSESITKLSPNFVETYNQSSTAEAQQLFQICGGGYRKALEYLVKDYLCHTQPDDVEKIRAMPLAACINRIGSNRIKTLAQRSTWIGNDETHYVRKHENLDIADMKRFIRAALTYIESELAFEDAEQIEPR